MQASLGRGLNLGFVLWCEIDWDKALRLTSFRLKERADRGEELPRSQVFEMVAANERPRRQRIEFCSRAADLAAVMAEAERSAVQAPEGSPQVARTRQLAEPRV